MFGPCESMGFSFPIFEKELFVFVIIEAGDTARVLPFKDLTITDMKEKPDATQAVDAQGNRETHSTKEAGRENQRTKQDV